MEDFEAQMEKLIRPLTTGKIEDLLTERAKTHGDYGYHASITQRLKDVMQNFHNTSIASNTPYRPYQELPATHAEALDMIAHKIGRILAGDPDFRDHWDDIAGYAKLVADRCTK